jgi:putative chitinase
VISVASLIAAGVPPTQARIFAAPLAAICPRFGITTPARIGAFVAQCRVESADFTQLEEGMYYRSAERIHAVFKRLRGRGMDGLAKLARNPQALANAAYAGVLGNGDEASGDGWRYRGRGLKQVTGRTNYLNAASELARPYLEHPELVAQPDDAVLTAAWFWSTIKGNILADSAQWDAITLAVNGPAMLQADLRRQYSDDAVAAFG